MTVQLRLPKDVEQRLVAQVQSGRHASLEDAILEKLSQNEEPDLLKMTGMGADQLRRELDDAWNNRQHAVDGESVFLEIKAKSDSINARSK